MRRRDNTANTLLILEDLNSPSVPRGDSVWNERCGVHGGMYGESRRMRSISSLSTFVEAHNDIHLHDLEVAYLVLLEQAGCARCEGDKERPVAKIDRLTDREMDKDREDRRGWRDRREKKRDRERIGGRKREGERGDENGEEERSSTLVGDPEHSAFLRLALSFSRALQACSERARTGDRDNDRAKKKSRYH